MDLLISDTSNYWYAGTNKNCPLGGIITTERECQLAVTLMGFTYRFKSESEKYPAGCYVFLGSKKGYFNSIIDPSTTSPEQNSSGICRRGMFLHHTIPCHFLQYN